MAIGQITGNWRIIHRNFAGAELARLDEQATVAFGNTSGTIVTDPTKLPKLKKYARVLAENDRLVLQLVPNATIVEGTSSVQLDTIRLPVTVGDTRIQQGYEKQFTTADFQNLKPAPGAFTWSSGTPVDCWQYVVPVQSVIRIGVIALDLPMIASAYNFDKQLIA